MAESESLWMNSQWQKGRLIGRGSFGSVYLATTRETGALCAMKEIELFPDDPKSAECIKQLQQEIKVLSQLKHPNIVQYYGSEIVDDRFFIYLEDIKGANLLVDSSGVAKLADFGMAKHLTEKEADLSLKGSPCWMAPELMQAVLQRDSSSDVAFAVDIWSLGCTIIEMFTGKAPWGEYEKVAAIFKVLHNTPPILETLLSEGKDFLRCCFERLPEERPSAAMLLEHPFVKKSEQLDGPSWN